MAPGQHCSSSALLQQQQQLPLKQRQHLVQYLLRRMEVSHHPAGQHLQLL
jgi:hypothetical protein